MYVNLYFANEKHNYININRFFTVVNLFFMSENLIYKAYCCHKQTIFEGKEVNCAVNGVNIKIKDVLVRIFRLFRSRFFAAEFSLITLPLQAHYFYLSTHYLSAVPLNAPHLPPFTSFLHNLRNI